MCSLYHLLVVLDQISDFVFEIKRLIFHFQNNWSSRSVLTFGKHSQTDPNVICLFVDSMEIFTTFLAVLLKMFWIKKKLKRRRKRRKRKKRR